MPMANPRISAAAFSLSVLLAGVWWSASTAMEMLHSDAKFVKALSATLDRPAVRDQLTGWLTDAIAQSSTIPARELAGKPAAKQLQRTLDKDLQVTPMVDALTAVTLKARNDAVSQLDRHLTPKHSVRLDLVPLVRAAGLPVDAATAKSLGLRLDRRMLSTPLIAPDLLDRVQRRYDLTAFAARWAGWVAFALLALSVLTSARPFRTLAAAAAGLALVVVVAPPLLAKASAWWSAQRTGLDLAPLTATLTHGLTPYALPVLVGGTLAALVLGAADLRSRRRRSGRR